VFDGVLQRAEHRQVRVDRIGFSLAAAGFAVRPCTLEYPQSGGGDGAGEADTVAAGALDRDRHPPSAGVLTDPAQQLGVAGTGVLDDAGGDRRSGAQGDLDLMGIAVGVDADHDIDDLCQHRHGSGVPSRTRVQPSAPAWMQVTGVANPVRSHALARTSF
jgi:hypothetical protein